MSDKMHSYMRTELWKNKVRAVIKNYEKVQGLNVPEDIKNSVSKFLDKKIDHFIKEGTLTTGLLSIAVSSLLYIKLKGLNK